MLDHILLHVRVIGFSGDFNTNLRFGGIYKEQKQIKQINNHAQHTHTT